MDPSEPGRSSDNLCLLGASWMPPGWLLDASLVPPRNNQHLIWDRSSYVSQISDPVSMYIYEMQGAAPGLQDEAKQQKSAKLIPKSQGQALQNLGSPQLFSLHMGMLCTWGSPALPRSTDD